MTKTVAIAAIVANLQKDRPPTLSMSFSANHNRHLRQSSLASQYFDAHEDSDGEDPPLSALDSSTALILVHDDEDEEESLFPFTDDEDEREGREDEDDDELVSPMFELRRSAVFPPLPPSLVFLYLLVPYLRLGALSMPYTQLPLKYGLPALFLSALAAAFTRQIWYMLARYVRKAKMSDVLLDTFARGRDKERQRVVIRGAIKGVMSTLGIFMSIVYLRYSMYTLYPTISLNSYPNLSYMLPTVLVALPVGYLSFARSLNYRRIIYATWLSLATYIAWCISCIYAHSQGILPSTGGWLGSGNVWVGLATTAFALCASSTLPLYTSLKSSSRPIPSAKVPPSRSFRILSTCSTILAVLLLLPSTLFSAFPNHPSSYSKPFPDQDLNINIPISVSPLKLLIDRNSGHIPVLDTRYYPTPRLPIPNVRIQIHTLINILSASTLILSVPSVLVASPPVNIPLRSAKFNTSRSLTLLFITLCALIPPSHFPTPPSEDDDPRQPNTNTNFLDSSRFFGVISLLVLFMAYTGMYFVPTFVHVSEHFFKRPIAIVVPPQTPLTHTHSHSPSSGADGEDSRPPSHREPFDSVQASSPRTVTSRVHDELLLRKERALQKRQFRRRIVWDVGVWALLITSVMGMIGYGGYLVGAW